jgi:hypothetical protein
MAFGWDDAAMFALQLASAGGGILGKKRKHIDPEMLRQKFGPGAVSKETMELANYILNSPHGQKLLAGAAEQGQQFGRDVNANAAAAGLAGPGGSSGTGIFATSAGAGAQSGFERAIKGDVYNAAMPVAANMVNQRQQAYINDLNGGGYQDDRAGMAEQIGQAASAAGTLAGPARQSGQTPVSAQPPIAAARPQPVQSALAAGDTPAMLRKRARRKSMSSIFNRGYVQPQMEPNF